MIKRKYLIGFIAFFLMALLAIQPVVHAGGENSVLNGLLAAVVTVATGGGYLAASLIGVAIGTQPSNPGGRTTTIEVDPKDLKVELRLLSGSDDNQPKSILVTVKDPATGNIIFDLPAELKLYAGHSNPNLYLVEGYAPPSAAAAGSSDNFIDINDCPQVSVSGVPSEIKYSLKKQCRSVRMDVIDSSGSVVYALSESSPNPSRPIPFVWKGKDTHGNGVSAGTYSVRLSALKNDGSEEFSPIQVMSIGETIDAGIEYEITSFSGGTATLRVWPPMDGSPDSDTVTVTLKYSGSVISSASHTVTFGGGAPTDQPTVSQNPLNYSTIVRDYIDGVLVEVEFSRGDSIVCVTSFLGEPDEIKYEYDVVNGQAKIITSSNTEIYTISDSDPHRRDVYYNILYTMDDLIKEIYNKKGIDYDYQTNTLSFSSNLSTIISSVTSGNIIELTTSSGKYNYDVSQNTLSTLSGSDILAGVYTWDESNNLAFIPDSAVAASGVKTMVAEAQPIELTASIRLPFSVRNFQTRIDIARRDIPEEIYPMERPQEPAIENITWVNRSLGVVKVEGTADMLNSTVGVVINGTNKFNVMSTSNNSWTFTNNNYPLSSGENKINVISSSLKGGQVESGDATVYLGDGNKPDLILVSPRDRMAKEHENINSASDVSIKVDVKGKTIPGAALIVGGKLIFVNSDGSFNSPIELFLREGTNGVSVSVSGSESMSINKTIIGVYKFVNGSRTNAYVLRRGDFVFNKGVGLGGGVKGAFDWVPFDPDHTGVYIGNGKIREAVWNNIKESALKSDGSWNGDSFHAATQIPVLLENEDQIRSNVAGDIESYLNQHPNTGYDLPFLNFFRLKLFGHYDGPNGGFYCSELAWWAWKKQNINFGITKSELLYPPASSFYENVNEDKHTNESAILPAYLCEKTMKVKEVNK
ncbi:MAG: FlgD immunoglobulin-like domain containing protein [Candidatus Auribacterota bacterium]|nr:FlgD immunoglobulin-like domain containing protein [Candidatus Auribacterota bacterium]